MNSQRPSVEELFRKYAPGVGSYVYARVGDAHVAEQITSGVFLHVVRRIDTCRESPQAWLWSIVRNELARHFRDRKPTESLPATVQDQRPSPHESAEREEMRARMRDALAQLNEQQQRIVYLKFFQGVPNTEIATELGISASNVGVIVHRAMARLRELLGGGEHKVRTYGADSGEHEVRPYGAESGEHEVRPCGADSGEHKVRPYGEPKNA